MRKNFVILSKKEVKNSNYIADAEKTLKIMHSVSKMDAKEQL